MFAQAKRQMELKDVIQHLALSLRALSVSINSSDPMQDKNPRDAIFLQLAPHVFDRTIDSKAVSRKTLYANWTPRKVGSFSEALRPTDFNLGFEWAVMNDDCFKDRTGPTVLFNCENRLWCQNANPERHSRPAGQSVT